MRETTDVRRKIAEIVDPYAFTRDTGGEEIVRSDRVDAFRKADRILAALEPAPKPAGGERVTVPRSDVEFIVRTANRNERTEEGDRLAVLLSAALTPSAADSAQDVGELVAAVDDVLETASGSYRAGNGRQMGIQADDGEKCWIVHSDQIEALRAALAAYKRSTTDGNS